ncbi:MAG: sulfatase [Candidatus Hydrogenedentes bacterium]|nr:sulfatase [Candidatus Hydrogenedentota bacterium]
MRITTNSPASLQRAGMLIVLLAWIGLPYMPVHGGSVCHADEPDATPVSPSSSDVTHAPSALPNILIVLIDTLRPDHLGCYGYARDTSPHIDALAAEGVRLTKMISQSSWTRPAVASLFTSTYPSVHGAVDRADILPEEMITLPEILQGAGYETAGFMTNLNCLPMWGFGAGFQSFVEIDANAVSGTKDQRAADAVIEALRAAARQPWFYYVHFFGPHTPYDPPVPFNTRFLSQESQGDAAAAEDARQIALYDGAIAFSDEQFGRIAAALKDLGMYEDTLIIVVADHGEALGDHGGWGHGTTLYDEQIRIPFVVKLPRGQTSIGVRDGLAELIDVAPTVLDFAGLPAPEAFQGRSLRDMLNGAPAQDRPAFSSLLLADNNLYSARDPRWKYIFDVTAQRPAWFDTWADPAELRPLKQGPLPVAPLAEYAARVASTRREGLHILVTGSLDEARTIAGTLSGSGMGAFQLRYTARNGDAQMDGDRLRFRITTSPGADAPTALPLWYEEIGEVNNAHLVIQVDPASVLIASLTLDDKPIPAEVVRLGANRRNAALESATLRVSDLEADSEAFYPSALPQTLAVYIWYVPPVDTVPDEALDPDMADAMKALGYIH